MNSNHPINTRRQNKWQQMSAIVAMHSIDSSGNFKKLTISRLLAETVLLCLFQYTGLILTTLSYPPAPLSLASGVVTGYVFMRGYSTLPGIWLGSFFAYYFSKAGLPLAFGCAVIYTLQACLLLWLSHRYITPTLIFYRFTTFVKFLLCATVLTAISSFLLVIISLPYLHLSVAPLLLWMQWWLANLDSILIISCAIVAWDFYFPQINAIKNLNKIQIIFSYGIILVLTLTLMNSINPVIIILSAVAMLPLIILISMSYGWPGSVGALFLIGIFLSFSSYFNSPFLYTHSPATVFIFIQILLCVEVILFSYLTLAVKKTK